VAAGPDEGFSLKAGRHHDIRTFAIVEAPRPTFSSRGTAMKTAMKLRPLLIAALSSAALATPALAQTNQGNPSTNAPMSAPGTMNNQGTGSSAGSHSGSSTMNQGTTNQGQTTGSIPGGSNMFYTEAWTAQNWRASEAIGMSVYNKAGERIGEIDDILMDNSGRVAAAVVGVGGFLGIGERKVAVNFKSMDMTRESNGNARLVVDLNKNSLQSAPEYKTPVNGKRS
jgi:sporulation protein YlmC with PRC-barrel domain